MEAAQKIAEEGEKPTLDTLKAELTATLETLEIKTQEQQEELAKGMDEMHIDSAVQFAEMEHKIDGSVSDLRDEAKTDLQVLRQDSDRALSDLKNQMERDDKKMDNDLRDLIKETRENVEDDVSTLEMKVNANADQASAENMEEVRVRSETVDALEKASTKALTEAREDLTGDLDKATKKTSADIKALQTQVDVEVTNKINTLDTDISGRLTDLKTFVEGSVAKSIADMTGKMDTMKKKIADDMQPELKRVAGVAENAKSGLDAFKSIAEMNADELKTGMTKSLEGLMKDLGELEETVDGMKQSVDIDAMLGALAVGAS